MGEAAQGAATRAQQALSRRLLQSPPRRVLVVQTAFLGDTVFTSALVQALRARFPEAALELCVSVRGGEVARAIPGVAQVHVFDKRGADRGPAGLLSTARRLRARRFDLAVLPHRSLRSALLALLARVPERVGFAGAPGRLFYTAAVPDAGATFVAREAQLGRALGAGGGAMRLEPLQEWKEAAETLLRARRESDVAPARLAALCLGSEWETKIWPAAHVAALAQKLRDSGFTPLLLGGPRERALAAEVARTAPGARCLDTTGNPVGEALALLARCALCVGGDTGLVHAARALGVPTVAVFGPTAPEVHELAARARAVSLHLACSPCSEHGSRRCPLGHHDCLRTLPASLVLDACTQVLEQP